MSPLLLLVFTLVQAINQQPPQKLGDGDCFSPVNRCMPLALVLRLSAVESAAQLYRELDQINNNGEILSNNATIGALPLEEPVERKGYLIPQPAKCMPELRTVRLGKNTGDWYFPSCTRIERCGGCCGRDDVLSCQPTELETINFQVDVLKYVGGNPPIQRTKEIIPVERHTSCKCGCKLKEKDCNTFQKYNKTNCECICTNNDEREKCENNSNIKTWKSDTCSCECLNKRDCNTGYNFNKNTCRCEAILRQRVNIGSSYSTDSRISLSRRGEATEGLLRT